MSRSERLLNLLQILRRHRRPVIGQILADELGISLRTLYRDIASLQAQGADIMGEPGLGYVLKPGYMLPPLMFSADEIEALVLGMRLVANRADPALALSARDALTKITTVLPPDLRAGLVDNTLLVGPAAAMPEERIDLAQLRRAIRGEQILSISYSDEQGRRTERRIWPFALAFFAGSRMLVAWCTLRNDFRHFRTDRVEVVEDGLGRYPKRKAQLLKAWREQNQFPDDAL